MILLRIRNNKVLVTYIKFTFYFIEYVYISYIICLCFALVLNDANLLNLTYLSAKHAELLIQHKRTFESIFVI